MPSLKTDQAPPVIHSNRTVKQTDKIFQLKSHRKSNRLFSCHYPGNTSQKFSRWQNRLRGNKRPKKTALHGTTTKTASIGKSRINSQSRVVRTCLRTSRMHSRRKVAEGILQKYVTLSTTFTCSPLLLANLSKRVKLGSWSV